MFGIVAWSIPLLRECCTNIQKCPRINLRKLKITHFWTWLTFKVKIHVWGRHWPGYFQISSWCLLSASLKWFVHSLACACTSIHRKVRWLLYSTQSLSIFLKTYFKNLTHISRLVFKNEEKTFVLNCFWWKLSVCNNKVAKLHCINAP